MPRNSSNCPTDATNPTHPTHPPTYPTYPTDGRYERQNLDLALENEKNKIEIEKYQKKIRLVEKGNDLIHKEIIGFYLEQENEKNTTKDIKKI